MNAQRKKEDKNYAHMVKEINDTSQMK